MDQQSPRTRFSLMTRLANAQDHEAWTEFTAIYEPLLMRILGSHGLQECDARDVCQQIFEAVAKDIDRWEPDGRDGSFRRWLFRIAKNRVLKFFERERRRLQAAGGSNAHQALEQQPAALPSLSEMFEREHREQLLVWAAEQVRGEFREATWKAFWWTCVDGRPIDEVARDLNLSCGSVYVARSRIIARIKCQIQTVLDDEP